jgi:hypothetical protein
MSCTTCAIISSHKRGTGSGSRNCLLYIDGEASEVVYNDETLPQKIGKVLVSKGKAYIGSPVKYTRTDGKSGEVGVLASVTV